MPTCIKVGTADRVCTITLSRPAARNAWTEVMRSEIVDAMDAASRDPAVRVVVVTGDPAGKCFCAGADLSGGGEKAFGKGDSVMEGDIPAGRPVNNSTWRDGGGTAGLSVVRCTKPTIAAINGHAVGVGITFPLVCDIRVVSEEAKVGFVFTKRGLALETLSSFYLPRVVGLAKAHELCFTGRIFSAKDGDKEAPGLFNHIVPHDMVLKKAYEIAREIADNTSGMSVVLSRFLMQRGTSPFNSESPQALCVTRFVLGA
jgi:enoyl-CoA hydratase/carnithine racemase